VGLVLLVNNYIIEYIEESFALMLHIAMGEDKTSRV
jgi:hypothetical protein